MAAALAVWALALAATAVAAGCGGGAEQDAGAGRDAGPSSRRPSTTAPPAPTTAAPPATAPATAPAAVAPATTVPAPPPSPGPAPSPLLVVVSVVDGDTIDLSDGSRVRLIGIDTPERGACGAGEATAALRWMVQGKAVALVGGARDDRDRYDRLLRYVELDGRDINQAMIASGHAVARYDSRDGYGRHAREDAYVAADATSAPATACGTAAAPSTLAPPPPAPATGGVDPRFRTCGDAKAAGLGPYTVGEPEYGWYDDRDGDGVVCE